MLSWIFIMKKKKKKFLINRPPLFENPNYVPDSPYLIVKLFSVATCGRRPKTEPHKSLVFLFCVWLSIIFCRSFSSLIILHNQSHLWVCFQRSFRTTNWYQGSSHESLMLLLGEGLLGLIMPLWPRSAISNAIKGFGFIGH